MATLKTVTLGCKVNQYETEFVRQALARRPAIATRPTASRPICASSTPARSRPRGTPRAGRSIRQLARRNPGTRIVVMGCYATRAPEEVAALPAVVEVVTDKRELPDLLGRFGVIDVPTGISRFARSPAGVCQSAGRLHAALQLLHHSHACGRTWPAGRSSTSSTKCGGWSTTAIARSC